jgi:DNA-directed RNA polymerase subunit RPC12/RpoP
MSKFYCTYCGQRIDASQSPAESKLFCPSCGKEIVVPHNQKVSDHDPSPILTKPTVHLINPPPSDSPDVDITPTKSGSSLGGKILSFVGKMVSLLITGIIVLVLSRACGDYIGKQAAERQRAKRNTTQTDQPPTQGTLVDYHAVGLTLRLPGRPIERAIPMPDAIKASLNLKSKHSYLFQNGTQTISISRDVFIEEFDFARGCDIIFEKYKSIDSSANQRQYYVDGISGRCFAFDAGDETYCELLVFNRGTTMWQVQVLDVASRADSTKLLSENIFSSIRISQ